MESEGMVLNDPQPMPVDPYCKTRKKVPKPCHKTPSDVDRTYQFLNMDRMVRGSRSDPHTLGTNYKLDKFRQMKT